MSDSDFIFLFNGNVEQTSGMRKDNRFQFDEADEKETTKCFLFY